MNTHKKLVIAIIIVLILIISFAAYLLITNKPENTSVCESLGCPKGTVYVGSVNSDKYYVCDCQYSKRIKPENIMCFSTDNEALSKNYTKVDC